MLVNNYPKQSPIIGIAGLGGGINSYIFLSSGGDYEISRSLRFNSGDSAHLNRTPSSAGNRKTWTWSGWVKRSTLGTGSGGRNVLFDSTVGWTGSGDTTYGLLNFSPDNQLGFGVASTGTYTTAIFRDTSAWYHVVAAMDTTQAAAADRLKLYVNGVQHTHSGYTFTQNTDYAINTATEHAIGMEERTDAAKFDGYLADIHFIDGQALAATDFGETDDDGVWQPKEFSGAHGTNGFHLDFKDNSSNAALGYDAAGSNNWTVNNLSVAAGAGNDSLRESPQQPTTQTDSGVGGEIISNYCTLNPLHNPTGTYYEGNLRLLTTAGNRHYQGTFGLTAGKWYWEVTPTSGSTPGMIGISIDKKSITSNLNGDRAMSYYSVSGNKQGGNTSGTDASYGASYTYNDVIGVALDLDSTPKTLTFYKNGSSQGVAFNPSLTLGNRDTIASWVPAISSGSSVNTTTFDVNFGQRAFAYAAPSGFKTVCAFNIPALTGAAAEPNKYFDTKLYAGTSASNAITMPNSGLSPDFVWIKNTNGSYNHLLFDAVRGATNYLESNSTNQEQSSGSSLTSFDSNGFTLGTNVHVNRGTGYEYAAWAWDAGSSTVSNYDGDITSEVRASQAGGFSIVKYTGNGGHPTDVGHGLNNIPGLVIVKRLDTTGSWPTYFNTHTTVFLNTNAASANQDEYHHGDHKPTTTQFSVGNNVDVNASGGSYIAYCFASIDNYSRVSTYTGNGSAEGTFVHTGFKPAFLLTKSYAQENWEIRDSKRNPFNRTNRAIFPHTSGAEDNGSVDVDFLSNGFKLRTTNGSINANGQGYMFYAVAEEPFKTARAR